LTRRGLLGAEVGFAGDSALELNQGHDGVVDDANELTLLAVGDFLHPGVLNGAQSVRLDKQLVGQRRQAKDAPRGAVVGEFLALELAAAGNFSGVLGCGVGHTFTG